MELAVQLKAAIMSNTQEKATHDDLIELLSMEHDSTLSQSASVVRATHDAKGGPLLRLRPRRVW